MDELFLWRNQEPSYLTLWRKGRLRVISRKLRDYLNSCSLCPRACGAHRMNDEVGTCGAGRFPLISSFGPHFGEERPLVGIDGSGTIFFTHCNLLCVFCQNYDISHFSSGRKVSITQLATMMLDLQAKGCHNLNLVTPTHVVPQIVEALDLAIGQGFRLPLVYNCGGYENKEIIELLEGIIDIYMPDVKFFSRERSRHFLDAEDYPDIVREVLREMYRQVGLLRFDERGIARHGLLVRHLVMPESTEEELSSIFHFLADELSPETYVNIMAQYRPLYKAREYPEINRAITMDEYHAAVQIARNAGIMRGFES